MLARASRLGVIPVASAASASRRTLIVWLINRTFDYFNEKRQKEIAISQAKAFPMLPQLMRTYMQATGHYVVPLHLTIPANSWTLFSSKSDEKKLKTRLQDIDWPEEAHGISFGRCVNTFWRSAEYQSDYPEVTRVLVEMGVLQRGETHRQLQWRKQTLPALRTYAAVYGNALVPFDFTVPPDDAAWPVEAKGLRLGSVVQRIRKNYKKGKLSIDQVEDLKAIGFSFDGFETTWSTKVLPSLEVFAQVHGHCDVPREFVVPKSGPWPRPAWGLRLGNAVTSMWSNNSIADQIARDADRLAPVQFVRNRCEYE